MDWTTGGMTFDYTEIRDGLDNRGNDIWWPLIWVGTKNLAFCSVYNAPTELFTKSTRTSLMYSEHGIFNSKHVTQYAIVNGPQSPLWSWTYGSWIYNFDRSVFL